MARINLAELALSKETQVRAIDKAIIKALGIKKLKAQGNDGAESEFVDPQKLMDMKNKDLSHLPAIYNFQDSL